MKGCGNCPLCTYKILIDGKEVPHNNHFDVYGYALEEMSKITTKADQE